jgi:hypothetical protein
MARSKKTYPGVVGLIHGERTKIDLWKIDRTERDSRINISHQCLTN